MANLQRHQHLQVQQYQVIKAGELLCILHLQQNQSTSSFLHKLQQQQQPLSPCFLSGK